jgi:hypothetical protein
MGAIAPSKVPKLIKKRDGDEPVKVFKQGGKVRRFKEGGESDKKDMARDVEERKQRRDNPSGLRFEGGGGKDEYATSAGGRLSYDMSMGKNATLSPYVEGFTSGLSPAAQLPNLKRQATTPSRVCASRCSRASSPGRCRVRALGNGVREKHS